MAKEYVFIVMQFQEDYEQTPIAHCKSLESAKDYIRGMASPEFKESKDPNYFEVSITTSKYSIVKKEII